MTCKFDQTNYWYFRFYRKIVQNQQIPHHISILFEFRKTFSKLNHLGYCNFIVLNHIKCNKDSTDVSKSSGLIGRWKLESSANFENFLTKIGVNYFVKKAAIYVRQPEVLIKYNENDEWVFSIRSTFINKDIYFISGVEFEEITLDGRHIKSIFKFDGVNKLVNEQKNFKTNKLECVGIRELNNDGKLVEVLKADDVVATRIYIKI